MITSRGVQLAALFMRGVETAIFANDACGAPIPWAMCCPWLFFDGKLFHFKLLKANNNTALLDICDGSVSVAHSGLVTYLCSDWGWVIVHFDMVFLWGGIIAINACGSCLWEFGSRSSELGKLILVAS